VSISNSKELRQRDDENKYRNIGGMKRRTTETNTKDSWILLGKITRKSISNNQKFNN
jgi:hypothetical protein